MLKNLNFSKNQLIIGVVVIIPVIALIIFIANRPGPLPEDTLYRGADTSFMYPRTLELEEYATHAAAVGMTNDDGFLPLVNVVRYQNDRDVAVPVDFMAFVRRQAVALCGSDNSIESITCSAPVFEPYISVQGVEGQKMSLTLTRTNLETGAITTGNYSPIYIFDVSEEPDPEEVRRYSAIFIYPGLSAILQGEDTDTLLEKIMGTFTFNDVASETAPVVE